METAKLKLLHKRIYHWSHIHSTRNDYQTIIHGKNSIKLQPIFSQLKDIKFKAELRLWILRIFRFFWREYSLFSSTSTRSAMFTFTGHLIKASLSRCENSLSCCRLLCVIQLSLSGPRGLEAQVLEIWMSFSHCWVALKDRCVSHREIHSTDSQHRPYPCGGSLKADKRILTSLDYTRTRKLIKTEVQL